MHNDNNFCLDCRKAFKRNAVCPQCGKELVSASHKIRVPKLKNLKKWSEFIKWLKDTNPYCKDQIERIYEGKY